MNDANHDFRAGRSPNFVDKITGGWEGEVDDGLRLGLMGYAKVLLGTDPQSGVACDNLSRLSFGN
jgi:hypothetical protein